VKKLLLSFVFGAMALMANAQTYCTPAYSLGCQYGDDIDDVFIGSFADTATGCSSSNYNVSTSDTIFIQQTVPTSVQLTSNWTTQYFGIWVDFNSDGDFSDAGEFLWASPSNNWASITGSITIPSTVSLGSYRMRIRSNYSSAPTAALSCSSFSYGEAHDYTVTVTTPPACPSPVFSAISATDTTATLSWTSNDSAFTVEYNVVGSTSVPQSVTTTNKTTTVSGLSPNTWYEFYIETDCSAAGNGYSQTVGPYIIKTLCTALSTPVYEGFDNDSTGNYANPNAPSCWYYVEDAGALGYGYITNATWNILPYSGSNYYHLYNSGDANYEALISPAIIGLDSGTKQMELYLGNTGWSSGNDVYVGTVSGPGNLSSMDIIDTLSVPNSGSWVKYTVYFNSSLGYNMTDQHIVIASSNASTYNAVYIDDITISDAPSCLPPSAISLGTVLMDSAQISFATQGIASYLEYGPPGFIQGTGTQVQVSSSPAWLTNLSANTTYDVYVVQMCADSSMSSGTGPVSFKTMGCSPSQMCTFDIELTDSWGDGWNGGLVEVVNSTGGVEYTLGAGFTTGTSYTETIQVCTGGTYTIVVSDDGSYPGEMGLNVISSGSTIASYTNSSSTTLGTQMASFNASCNALCPNPTNLTFVAGKNDASFSFDKNGGTGTYVYSWGATGFVQATGAGVNYNTDSTTSSNFSITGLSANSCYDLILIQNCGSNGASDTLGPITFCTGACDTTDLCSYTMSMYDTWGDGWNGATVDIYYNGAYANTFGPAFTTGDSSIVTFDVCAGTEIAVVNGAQGSYPGEVYYTLSNAAGTQSVSISAGNFNAGPVDTLYANCVTPSCATPSGLAATVGGTFADVTWTGGNGTFIYSYTKSGSTIPQSGTTSTALASLTGLQSLTTYYFNVAEICAPGDTSLRMNFSFTTDSCSAISNGNPNYSVDSVGANFADITFNWLSASGYNSYFINFGDGSNTSGSGSGASHTYTSNGQYTATLKLYGDCDTTTQQIFVSVQGIGLEENALASTVLLYPNPSQGLVTVRGTSAGNEVMVVRVINYLGQVVVMEEVEVINGAFEKSFDLSAYSNGTYLIELNTASGLIQKPIIIRH
jgi:hypothetical protein